MHVHASALLTGSGTTSIVLADLREPETILAAFRTALPAGSYLALSHATADLRPAAAQHAAAVYDQATSTVTLRSRAQVAAFFEGWDLVEQIAWTPLAHACGCVTDWGWDACWS